MFQERRYCRIPSIDVKDHLAGILREPHSAPTVSDDAFDRSRHFLGIEAYELALAHGGPEPALRRLIELLENAGRGSDAQTYRDLLPPASDL